jgi:hypothetical protein
MQRRCFLNETHQCGDIYIYILWLYDMKQNLQSEQQHYYILYTYLYEYMMALMFATFVILEIIHTNPLAEFWILTKRAKTKLSNITHRRMRQLWTTATKRSSFFRFSRKKLLFLFSTDHNVKKYNSRADIYNNYNFFDCSEATALEVLAQAQGTKV